MPEKRFLRKEITNKNQENKNLVFAGKVMFYFGMVILIFGLIYMIFNLDKSDRIIWVWLSFMIAGIMLVLVSLVFKWQKGWRRK
jgi:cell division protein FtsW (lipid II flippase)